MSLGKWSENLSCYRRGGGVGYFSHERGFSVESSLQRIPSKFLLWKWNDSSVVLYTWSQLTRQTCGQRSSRAAESKRRLTRIGNYVSERICYMFLISKCRGDRDLGMCTTSVLTFGESQRSGKIQVFLRQNTFFFRILPFGAGRSQEKRRNRKERMGKFSMKYVVNWISLRIRVRSRNIQPHLNQPVGWSRFISTGLVPPTGENGQF